MKNILCIALLLCCLSQLSYAQPPTSAAPNFEAAKAAWNKAKTLVEDKAYQAAKPELLYVYEEMQRPLCAYYLGLVYELEGELDSACYYYKKCIRNSRKPMIQAQVKLIRSTLRSTNIEKAYQLAKEAVEKYPDNESLRSELKNVCLWAFMQQQGNLSMDYLIETTLKEAYTVSSITQQELVIANIRNEKDESILVNQRIYKGDFEIWKCHWRSDKTVFEIRFNLEDRNLDRALDQQHQAAWAAYEDLSSSEAIKIGAFLALTPLPDKTLLKLLKEETSNTERICICSEVKKHQGSKLKKACLKDQNESVRKAAESMKSLQK